MGKHILVVDDEARIREVVQYALEKEGHTVTAIGDGQAALDAVSAGGVDLVVLDVMLPHLDGLTVCRRIRAVGATPVLFLSARGDEIDRVVGLELGGDDYLVKPFSARELVARVRAILRRTGCTEAVEPTPTVLRHGAIQIDLERHEVRFAEHRIDLTATEFALLVALIERPGVVLSRRQLMGRAYPDETHVTERTLDSHVRRIRSKFRAAGGDPIATVHGVGYKAADT